MPNRVIKESALTSRTLAKLSDAGQVHFYKMMLRVDDHGRLEVTPEIIKGACYPLQLEKTPEVIAQLSAEMESVDLLRTWWDGDRQYGVFHKFDKHSGSAFTDEGKRTRNRPKTPEPPKELLSATYKNHGANVCQPAPDGASLAKGAPLSVPSPFPLRSHSVMTTTPGGTPRLHSPGGGREDVHEDRAMGVANQLTAGTEAICTPVEVERIARAIEGKTVAHVDAGVRYALRQRDAGIVRSSIVGYFCHSLPGVKPEEVEKPARTAAEMEQDHLEHRAERLCRDMGVPRSRFIDRACVLCGEFDTDKINIALHRTLTDERAKLVDGTNHEAMWSRLVEHAHGPDPPVSSMNPDEIENQDTEVEV